MHGALKFGLALGVAAVGTVLVLKKVAPEVLETAKEQLKKVKPLEFIVKPDKENVVVFTEEIVEEAIEDVPAAEAEEWPDLSQIPEEQPTEVE